VLDAVVGYSGGFSQNPTYRQVCQGKTGHAEVVQVTYDPAMLPFKRLLELFQEMHNPCAGWRTDPTSQYRSAIYTTTEEQLAQANAWRASLECGGKRVSTEIKPAEEFWRAEDYHQRYYEKHGLAACNLV
jgi:peptide-methionine (S)-S-oxide reductase